MNLKDICNDIELIEVGRKAIEDTLIDFRDRRISAPLRNNGLVVREKDGSDSSVIRIGPEQAIVIALRAIEEHIKLK